MMGAFDESAIEMLGMFCEMTAPLVETLRDAHVAGDVKQVAEIAHSLKGAARSACCNAMGDVAATLQDEADEGAYEGALIEAIEVEFARVQDEVSALS